MKVMHLLKSNAFSGAENVVCQIMKMFEGSDIEMVYTSPDGEIKKTLEQKNISYFRLSEWTASEVKRAIAEYQPNIIHAHDRSATLLASLIAPPDILILSHIHGRFEDMSKVSLKSISFLLVCKRIHHIFWVSDSAFREFHFSKQINYKSSVLYNVMDSAELYEQCNKDLNNYDYDIVFLGRLTYPKNPQRLIKVISKVCSSVPNVKVAIIGTGDLDDEIKSLVTELGLESNIDFWGFQSNPYKMLKCSKLMLMTSRSEGTPMCVLEAMALGVPVVSTPTDGICDLIENNVTGILSDSDDILSEEIVRLIADKDHRLKMSQAIQKRFKEICNIDRYKEKLALYYKMKD